MANRDHIAILQQGVGTWNAWRAQEPSIKPDLSDQNLGESNLARLDNRIDLRDVDFSEENLTGTGLGEANLNKADLRRAALGGANLGGALLREADLRGAFLRWAMLSMADLTGAKLAGANLERTNMIEADLTNADLTCCRIYGMSAWDLKLEGTTQQNLIITLGEPEISVDNIEVAQFIYLLINNEKTRDVIDTIGKKAVLILGRFTQERMTVLDGLRNELRMRGYLPILFDFAKPDSKDLTGTVLTLAHMARFIIADVTDPRCIPYELANVIPDTFVPVQPILLSGESEFAMFGDLRRRYHWVLETHCYDSEAQLTMDFEKHVLRPAEEKVRELQQRRFER